MTAETQENRPVVDPEVPERPIRRQFTAPYKLKVLREADKCTQPGQIGALLRREGLYASQLTLWRRQRAQGELEALNLKRGRKSTSRDPVLIENKRLRRENEVLQRKLKQAETLITVQKKISEILGIPLKSPDDGGNG